MSKQSLEQEIKEIVYLAYQHGFNQGTTKKVWTRELTEYQATRSLLALFKTHAAEREREARIESLTAAIQDTEDIVTLQGPKVLATDVMRLFSDRLAHLTLDKQKEPQPLPCPYPDLEHHCTGCTDSRSEGTHQGCTIEHGHIGCDKQKG